MPNPDIYTTELATFTKKYNLSGYDLNSLSTFEERFPYLNDFTFEKTIPDTPAEQFVNLAKKTLFSFLEANTKPNKQGQYMSSLDLDEFLMDFDNLANAKYRSELEDDQAPNRDLYDGATLEDFSKSFDPRLKDFNKTLPAMWKDNLKTGAISLKTLKDVTDKAYPELMANAIGDKEKMNGHLTNMVAAYEAMKLLRESRSGILGWLWKVIFNREQNRQEKEYLNELATKVNDLKIMKYKVAEKTAALTSKTVLGEKVKNANQKAAATIEPVMAKLNHKRNDITFKGEFAKKCFQAIPENAKGVISETMLRFTLAPSLFERMDILNQKFDEGIENGNEPKVEMERIVASIFKKTTQVTEAFAQNLSPEAKLASTKAITKVMVDTLTAASIYPNELGGFVDEYIEQNAQHHQEIASDFWKEVNRQKGEDLKVDSEPVFGKDNNPFVDNNANKSMPVTQQPTQSVPTINTNK